MLAPEEEEQKDKEFEPAKDEEEVEEFETVEEETEPEVVEEFDGFDENAPADITTSGFKTKGGEIPNYEPTVDEVLSYAMGKTADPSEPVPDGDIEPVEERAAPAAGEDEELPSEIEEALDEIIEEISSSPDKVEKDELSDIFDEDEEEEGDVEGDKEGDVEGDKE